MVYHGERDREMTTAFDFRGGRSILVQGVSEGCGPDRGLRNQVRVRPAVGWARPTLHEKADELLRRYTRSESAPACQE